MNLKPDKAAMQAAIGAAERNKTPFGAALAMGDQVFTSAAGRTEQENDPTAHAAIEVIRKLSQQVQKKDLSGFVLYATCEPCTMCMSAVILAGIEAVVYGCGISVVSKYMDQIEIRSEQIFSLSSKKVELYGNFMEPECESLLQKFS